MIIIPPPVNKLFFSPARGEGVCMEYQLEFSWEALLSDIRSRIDRQQYAAWFKKVHFSLRTPDTITLAVPSNFHRYWMQQYYYEPVLSAIAQAAPGRKYQLEIVVDPALLSEDPDLPAPGTATLPSPPASPGSASAVKEHNYEVYRSSSEIKLNDHYTFDNFIVGPCNRLSHAASLAVSESPSQAYNPLFLHGGSGLGKTHLLQAICHQILAKPKKVNVLYLSCESFVNQFITAVQNKELDTFRFKYRHVDVLLIDDIHFLTAKDRTQEEFFHTFNTLYNAQKQIILSSDSPPKEIPTLEDRLVSRFKWGMVARIDPPSFETRAAILQHKAKLRHIALPDEVITLLAESVNSNIRELEGAFNKVVGYSQLQKQPLDLRTAREALRDLVELSGVQVGMEDILKALVEKFPIKLSDLQSSKRTKSVAFPRQIGMYLARKMTDHSLSEVGGYFGGRDHSTVLHACDKISTLVKSDPQLQQKIDQLINYLKKP